MLFEFERKWVDAETTAWPEFPSEGKSALEQIRRSEEFIKSKRVGLKITDIDPSMNVNYRSKVVWGRKILRVPQLN